MRGSVHGNALYFIRSTYDPTFARSAEYDQDFLEHCAAMFGDDVGSAVKRLEELFGVKFGVDYLAWQELIDKAEASGEIDAYYVRLSE